MELLKVNELEGAILEGRNVRILRGLVAFRYFVSEIRSDNANQFYEESLVETNGKVSVVENEVVKLKTNYLKIDTKKAIG